MAGILRDIAIRSASGEKLLAALIDPDKFDLRKTAAFLSKLPKSITHLFVGGSRVQQGETEKCVLEVKKHTALPVVIFPGDVSQISHQADALLFLSLLSGRNPEYLIGQQVRAVPYLLGSALEIIPTAYLLIDGGKETAVQRVSRTQPLSQDDPEQIVHTALAAKYSGKKLLYLEAGSGAAFPVGPEIIGCVKKAVELPLIVGGGIRSREQMEAAYGAGADMLVIGTAFEEMDLERIKSRFE